LDGRREIKGNESDEGKGLKSFEYGGKRGLEGVSYKEEGDPNRMKGI